MRGCWARGVGRCGRAHARLRDRFSRNVAAVSRARARLGRQQNGVGDSVPGRAGQLLRSDRRVLCSVAGSGAAALWSNVAHVTRTATLTDRLRTWGTS